MQLASKKYMKRMRRAIEAAAVIRPDCAHQEVLVAEIAHEARFFFVPR